MCLIKENNKVFFYTHMKNKYNLLELKWVIEREKKIV